jgi:C1A family cysteine protease
MAAPGGQHNDFGLGKLYQDPKFGQYCSRFNKGPRTLGEFQQRQGLFHEADNIIGKTNRDADTSGVSNPLRLAHNWLSDRTDDEKSAFFGLDTAVMESKKTKLKNKKKGKGLRKGRKLVADAMNVDHAKDGHMNPVKNQGGCGSCWAFASTTALEGAIAKRNNTNAIRLSEQQSVDCTLRNTQRNRDLFNKDYGCWGCQGCWMSNSWDLMKEQGVMSYDAYPYKSGNTGREYNCEHDFNNIWGYVTDYQQIRTNTDDMKAKLVTHPLSVALDAGKAAFQYYSSGVVRASDNCGTTLNHAVVIVGYTDEDGDGNDDDSNDNDDNDNDDNDNDDNDNDDNDDDTTPPTPTTCKVTKWWHTCRNDVESKRRNLADSNGNTNYWKVQNSWGTRWGDQGFILIEISGGAGVCGINSVVEWVDGCQKGVDANCRAS